LLLLVGIAAIASYRAVKTRPFFVGAGTARWRRNSGELLSLLIFAGVLAWAVRGYFYQDVPVHLEFPLRNGWYYVAHGGNSTLVNHHNGNRAQRYGLDLVGLNAWGARAQGIRSTALERYVIFGATVHSPCDGIVQGTVDRFPNLVPPATDPRNPAGNHVVITCRGVDVVLAHLHPGSVAVEPGQVVASGQPVGLVGNSGNTTEPHLHIHAVRGDSVDPLKGEGVPILFDGVFPVRNTTF
jgi:hypothetical protein